jgi:hypothetical protein
MTCYKDPSHIHSTLAIKTLKGKCDYADFFLQQNIHEFQTCTLVPLQVPPWQ